MQSITYQRYGGPEELTLEETAIPPVADDAVLVRVQASSVNAYDWHMLRGKPYLARFQEGFRTPKTHILGLDAAGVVEAVGKDVTHLQPGDEVFGARIGALAEFVSGRNFVAKPTNLTFEQAAAIPVAGCTALQALRDKGRLEAGQHVLVTGAGGGVGSFAVQIAKAWGATVTAVTSTAKVEAVRAIGADDVIDHTWGEYTAAGGPYDLIVDAGSNRSLRALRRVLAPGGAIVLVGPGTGNWLGPITRVATAVVRSRLGRGRMLPFLSQITRDDLLVLQGLAEAGQLTPMIDRVYPLRETAAALAHLESGRAAGKVVVSVGPT